MWLHAACESLREKNCLMHIYSYYRFRLIWGSVWSAAVGGRFGVWVWEWWLRFFLRIHSSSICAHYNHIQLKFNHWVSWTKVRLSNIKLDIDPICDKCSQAPATFMHIFWFCPKLLNFRSSISNFMSEAILHHKHWPFSTCCPLWPALIQNSRKMLKPLPLQLPKGQSLRPRYPHIHPPQCIGSGTYWTTYTLRKSDTQQKIRHINFTLPGGHFLSLFSSPGASELPKLNSNSALQTLAQNICQAITGHFSLCSLITAI